MAQYIWFKTSTSTPTPSTTPYRSTPLAQRLWLNTSGSTPLAQYLRLNIPDSIYLTQYSDSTQMAHHQRPNTFGATQTGITHNLWLITYASKPLPRALRLILPLDQHLWTKHLWLNISGTTLLTPHLWPTIKGLIHSAKHQEV